jgi:hypothetical protein
VLEATKCRGRKASVAQGSLPSLAAFPLHRAFGGAAQQNSGYLVGGAARAPNAGKGAGPESGHCATTKVQITFSWTPVSARPCAVGGRLAVPWFRIHHAERRVGQALPLRGDRFAQGGRLQAQRLQFDLRLCDPEVASVNSSLELTMGSRSMEMPSVTRAWTTAPISEARQRRFGRIRSAWKFEARFVLPPFR